MPKDLTRLSRLDKLKAKAEKSRKPELPQSKSKGKGRKKSNRKGIPNLAPNVDFLPSAGAIFISKADYMLEEELADGYILRKTDLREQRQAEKAGAFEIRKRLNTKLQRRLV